MLAAFIIIFSPLIFDKKFVFWFFYAIYFDAWSEAVAPEVAAAAVGKLYMIDTVVQALAAVLDDGGFAGPIGSGGPNDDFIPGLEYRYIHK